MSKFDSAEVEALDYDFTVALKATSLAGDEQVKGTVPEPPQEVIVAYLEGVQDIRMREAEFARSVAAGRRDKLVQQWRDGHDGKEPPDDLAYTAGDMLSLAAEDKAEREEFRVEIRAVYIDTIAKACQGTPRRELLEALPERHLQAFAGWLAGMFSPEAVAAGIYG